MANPLGSLNKTFVTECRVGPAYLWVNPPLYHNLTNPNDPFNNKVLLSVDGNDPNNIIPLGIPRPVSGGLFLGYDEDGITEQPQLSYENIPIAGSTIPYNVRIKEESLTVKAKLLFNDDKNILKILRPPLGVDSVYGFTFGGRTEVSLYPLLLILTNTIADKNYVECHLYWRGYFEPTQTISGKVFNGLDMTYHAISGLDANGCLLPAGSRIVNAWYVRVCFDGTNILIDPNQIDEYGNMINGADDPCETIGGGGGVAMGDNTLITFQGGVWTSGMMGGI